MEQRAWPTGVPDVIGSVAVSHSSLRFYFLRARCPRRSWSALRLLDDRHRFKSEITRRDSSADGIGVVLRFLHRAVGVVIARSWCVPVYSEPMGISLPRYAPDRSRREWWGGENDVRP